MMIVVLVGVAVFISTLFVHIVDITFQLMWPFLLVIAVLMDVFSVFRSTVVVVVVGIAICIVGVSVSDVAVFVAADVVLVFGI